MRRTTIYLYALGLAVVVMAATFVSAGLSVSAQNSNSSMTMTENKPMHRRAMKPRGRCDPTQQEQTDLSGTYTGKLKHGDEAAMDATLTITGNSFSISMGSDSHSGRIVAVTTCGYTAVTVMPEGAPHAHSLRAKKVGDSLTLMSVPGEPEKMMFTTGGGMRPPRKHRMHKPAAPAATPSMTPPQQ